MSNFKKYIPFIIGTILLFLCAWAFIPKKEKDLLDAYIKKVKVVGSSMAPTLNNNEIVYLKKLKNIHRFDIIMLTYNKEKLIKRVIALPNETIEIKNNEIYINDQKIENSHLYGKLSDQEKIILQKEEYFVLGDNLDNSLDSRVFGSIKKDTIKGIIEKKEK